jgi:hypothetical protein
MRTSFGPSGSTVTARWLEGGLLLAALTAGPGSAEQSKLFGLLCSLLKFASQQQQQQQQNEGWLTDAVLAAAMAAASILQGPNSRDSVLAWLAQVLEEQQQQQQQQQQPRAEEAGSQERPHACAPDVEACGSPRLSSTPAGPQEASSAATAAAGSAAPAPGSAAGAAANAAPAAASAAPAPGSSAPGQHTVGLLPWLVLFNNNNNNP